MSRRSEQLKDVSAGFLQIHRDWADPENNQPNPTESYWDAVDSVVDAFTDEDIPGECRELANAADMLRVERDEFDNRTDPDNGYPANGFWDAVEAFSKALADMTRKDQPLPPLESIASLKQLPHMTDSNIAMIWGLKDRNDNFSVALVQRELDNPGSVTKTPGGMDGRDWIDPRLAKRKRQKAGSPRQQEELAEKGRDGGKKRKPATETPHELWEQQLTVPQAARVLGMKEPEIEKLFKGFDAERDAKVKSGKIVPAKTQAIREQAKKGKGATAIAKEMDLPHQVVTEALQ